MSIPMVHRFPILLCCDASGYVVCVFLQTVNPTGSLHGKVVDPLGNACSECKNRAACRTTAKSFKELPTAEGSFNLTVPAGGRYAPRVEAPGFATENVPPIFLSAGKTEELTVSLRIGPSASTGCCFSDGNRHPGGSSRSLGNSHRHRSDRIAQ